ncbi:hypothetical protein G7Y79_00031g066350 [Physcia stellaris]|nr:hypothetical protein G7Y79_00031g066350 [Physcia stellaris]
MKVAIRFGVALLPIVIAKAILPRQFNYTTTTIRIFAAGSHTVIDFSYLNASGHNFWIGKDTASYCPPSNFTLCPAGTVTAFENRFGEDTLGMDTIVAGGQTVYVAPNGALSFTFPHSAYLPPGSSYQGFQLLGPLRPSLPGVVRYNESNFLACPTKGTQGPYQIFVDLKEVGDDDVPGGCVEECIGFTGFTAAFQPEQSGEPAAYEYR